MLAALLCLYAQWVLIDSMELASSKGSRWADPDMRTWEGDSGTLHSFNWTA